MVRKFLLVVPMILLFARCDTPVGPKEVALAEVFDIAVGQTVMVRGEKVEVGFTTVAEDTRCPVDVHCVAAGNARIVVALRNGQESGSSELNTTVEPRSSMLLGYSIRLVDLKPYPLSTRQTEPGEYVATLVVTKR